MKHRFAIALFASLLLTLPAAAQVGLGVLSDFETETLEGWSGNSAPTVLADGGPLGTGDAFLRIGGGNRFATFNTSLSGVLDPAVTNIQVDLMRPAGQSDFEMRLVLIGPGTSNRWTSTDFQIVPGNGQWDTYTFSVAEADLTQALGAASYADLTSNLNRIMLRHDPGPPSATGISASGTLGIDNVTAVPEPASIAIALVFSSATLLMRKRA